jgi:uncharacterized alpha/beta hydrolase family protein
MIKEIPKFQNGTYKKECDLYSEIYIGSINCVGYSKLNISPCKYCLSYKEDKTYFLPILKENAIIVSEVLCNRPGEQLSIF